MDNTSNKGLWLSVLFVVLGLLVGTAGGYYMGYNIGFEKAASEVLNAENAENPFAAVEENPLEDVKTNPFE